MSTSTEIDRVIKGFYCTYSVNLFCKWSALSTYHIQCIPVSRHKFHDPILCIVSTWICNCVISISISLDFSLFGEKMVHGEWVFIVQLKKCRICYMLLNCIAFLPRVNIFEKRQTPQLLVKCLLKITSLYIWIPITMNNNKAANPATTRSSKMMLCTQQCNTIES